VYSVHQGVEEQRTCSNGGRHHSRSEPAAAVLLLLVTRCLAQMTLPFRRLAGCGRFQIGRKLDLHGRREDADGGR